MKYGNIVLQSNSEQNSYFNDYIHQAENAFKNYFINIEIKETKILWFKRGFNKILLNFLRLTNLSLVFDFRIYRNQSSFSFLCGHDFGFCFPDYIFSKEKYLYIFDAWPRDNLNLIRLSEFYKIDSIFFSSLQSMVNFNSLSPRKIGHWIPEGINQKYYFFHAPSLKSIDVVAFGRKHDAYHKKVLNASKEYNFKYIFKKEDINDLAAVLASSKISICFPSSTTHPSRSEDISTMTLRYLQSMISKCLIIGEIPYDMKFLFDYDPIITYDYQDPVGQLMDILENYDKYEQLIEKNYKSVLASHTWENRFNKIIEMTN